MKHEIFISTGSNIDKASNTQQGLDALAEHFDDIQVSSIYESQAVGFEGAAFYNAVVKAYTDKSLREVCEILKQIELDNGRVKQAEKFSSRTLDLDLLTYDDIVCDAPIELPRGEILYNAFVLQPLAELAPENLHPITKVSYSDLWTNYDKHQQRLWIADFTWKPKT